MSFRPLLRSRAIAPTATAFAVAGIVLFPRTTLHAETVDGSHVKKPIYDDEPFLSYPSTPSASHPSHSSRKSTSPTPTDRLAAQIGKSRMFLHAHVAAAEAKVNSMMDSFLHLENSFTSTIASLAPPPESGEKLMPGTLYVLVAAMTGSIISRNRNIFLRGAMPLALGIGAGWVVLPNTMRNVSNMLWKYEQQFPAIAETHLRTRKSIQRAWELTQLHKQQAAAVIEEKVGEGREVVEGWVRKGN